MSDLNFNYKSARSEKARIGALFSQTWIVILTTVALCMLIIGICLIIIGLSIGWAVIGLASIPAMIEEWYRHELRDIPTSKDPKTIDDVLSSDILGRLSKNPSPRELSDVVSGSSGSQFFHVRFGVGVNFLQNLLSESDIDMQPIWEEAWSLMEKTQSGKMNGAVLVVALIKNTPNFESLLSHLQLDIDELEQGIIWYNHLSKLIEKHRDIKKTGGMARDWSFGWTPLLSRFGQNISEQVEYFSLSLVKLSAHEDSLDQIISIFGKKGRQNATLIGPLGVGKTRIVHAFAYKILDGSEDIPSDLKYRQVFLLDASSLIAAAPDRGGLEQLVPRVLGEAYAAKNIVICLDNAELFFEEGVGSVDISNVLMPIIEAGNLRMILTMDEQNYLRISKRNPQLANILNRINVAEASEKETIAVMQDRSILAEFQNNVTFMFQALSEAYRLGDRYVHDLVMPGKAITVMESAAHYSENGLVTAESVRQSIEKTLGIKVSVASDDDEREKLLNMEELIHQRMINQIRAVNVVSDALRRARAGVRNQNRPIGTFLFLGPTGVGKSELAKALADVYFGGEDRMIRLDMNEYVSSDDVNRLIADGADNPNSLTARAMKQPFSVVLLDEVEKAHPNVILTLLQMLDEGILRDVKNREVSFRDAIVIATSNAGADRIREYIERGYDLEQFENKFVDELISSNQFKPEFLNRFDEIVVFRPLNKKELLQVVDLILAGVNKTLALQKISVDVADDAKEYLVEAGYDPRLGARPMRRVIQRAVENTVAKQMLSGNVEPGSVVEISLQQVKEILDSKTEADNIAKEISGAS